MHQEIISCLIYYLTTITCMQLITQQIQIINRLTELTSIPVPQILPMLLQWVLPTLQRILPLPQKRQPEQEFLPSLNPILLAAMEQKHTFHLKYTAKSSGGRNTPVQEMAELTEQHYREVSQLMETIFLIMDGVLPTSILMKPILKTILSKGMYCFHISILLKHKEIHYIADAFQRHCKLILQEVRELLAEQYLKPTPHGI